MQTHTPSFTACIVYSLTYLFQLFLGCAMFFKGNYRCAVLGTHAHILSLLLVISVILTSSPPQSPTKLPEASLLWVHLLSFLSPPPPGHGEEGLTASWPGCGNFLGPRVSFPALQLGLPATHPMSLRLGLGATG